jgi:LPPG:FO 2-phospho-L-lactate transferase
VITALAGGVGAARFLRGLVEVMPPREVTAIVNTADDTVLHGLHISPDLDTVTYTLADAVNPETGWGRAGESWRVMEELGQRGGDAWFRLGDLDLATHLHRTGRLQRGASLSEVTVDIVASFGVQTRILPMSDDPVATKLVVDGEGEIDFQDYFVARRHSVPISSVRFAGADTARPAAGVIDAIAEAEQVVICPSNPIVSIGPILAVPGIREAIAAVRERTVAISPIVAGAALKGPADRMLVELGHEPSVVGVARLYAPLAQTLVVDDADAALADAVRAEGMTCVVTPTIMHTRVEAADLARTVLETTRVP